MIYDENLKEDLRRIIADQAIEIADLRRQLQIEVEYTDALQRKLGGVMPPDVVGAALEIGGKFDVYAGENQDETV